MARRDLSSRDASSVASSELEYVIRSGKDKTEPVKTISVQEALADKRLYKAKSDREVTRVLFISQNTSLLNPTKQSLDGYLNLSELFDEVHILILRQGIPPKNPSLRVADNIWIYTISTTFWWWSPVVALKLLEEQLVFASGFRADLIVARDPFESALVAYKIGEKYNRPAQLHILEEFQSAGFLRRARNNIWRRYLARFTIPHFQSVRTTTESLLTYIKTKFNPSDIQTLPKFQDYESLITATERIDLKDKYRPHIVFLLFVGKLDAQSRFVDALQATRFVLRNPRVALLVLGDGKARSEFKRRVKAIGVEKQVVFESKAPSAVPYLKSGHILVVTDTDADSEELVLKGAAAGIPMVMTKTEFRADTFINGVSAYMCEPGDQETFTGYIDDLLNKPELRDKFTKNAQAMIRQKFHTDPGSYRESYRNSIEEAFFVDAQTSPE